MKVAATFAVFVTCLLVFSPLSKAERADLADGRPILGPWCVEDDKRGPGQPKPYCGDLPTLASVNIREAQLKLITRDLKRPWAMEFIDAETLLINEFPGSMKRLSLADGTTEDIDGLPKIAFGRNQEGLLDLVLHPAFASNGLVYFSYVSDHPQDATYVLNLARATLVGTSLNNVEVLIKATPFSKLVSNFGGAILFESDDTLLFSTGDRARPKSAQNPQNLHGKILRLKDDGSIPADNPFVDDPGYHPAVYSIGVRNPQGLVKHPQSGLIYETEHGPMGGDEVNLISGGLNYGWPTFSYGMDYLYKSVGVASPPEGFELPLFYYLPSRAISPIEVYSGPMFPEWEGDLLVGALRAWSVSRIDLHQGRVLSESIILKELKGRVRDIKSAPDGAIFLLVENGKLFRLSRSVGNATVAAAGEGTGRQIYHSVCHSCHSQKVPGAPQLGAKADWAERLPKGEAALVENSVKGYGAMPAMGLCEYCTEEDIARAVAFMLGRL